MTAAGSLSSADVLLVRLGSTLVGTLTRLPTDAVVFGFAAAFEADADRPTLGLAFQKSDGSLVPAARPSRIKLPPYFSNLLPEGPLRQRLAARGGVHQDREFHLLWLLGADLPGAIVVEDAAGRLPQPDRTPPPDAGRSEGVLRFSLAGVQLKFSAVLEARGGLTIPVSGIGGDWIAKLPSPRFDAVPENEFAMMTLARRVGIDVPEVRLVPVADISGLPRELTGAGGRALAVRRFDRTEDRHRIHIEDFAQVFGLYPDDRYGKASYGNIVRVLAIETPGTDVEEFVRRLVFNALIGNADAHCKNWSLIYPDGRHARLAPAYDLVSTIPYLPDDRMALSVAGTQDFRALDIDRFTRFADRAQLPVRAVLRVVRETADRVRDVWPTHEPLDLLSSGTRAAIASHMAHVPL